MIAKRITARPSQAWIWLYILLPMMMPKSIKHIRKSFLFAGLISLCLIPPPIPSVSCESSRRHARRLPLS